MPSFNVTQAIYTAAGCERCRGYIEQNLSLREAIRSLFETRTSHVDGIECAEPSDSDTRHAQWITVYNGMEFKTGMSEQRSLHFPETLTGASRARLCALIIKNA